MIKRATAVVEILLILVVAILASKLLEPFAASWFTPDQEPVFALIFRWIPLVLLALLIDCAIRRRALAEWGLGASDLSMEGALTAARLLFAGGTIPLLITLALPQQPPPTVSTAIMLAALAIPLIGQEIYLAGFGQSRLRDAFGPLGAAIVIASFFILAHAQHAGQGIFGLLFIAAIAWQGFLWSGARSAGTSLLPLIAAHLALLLCYQAPRIGLGVAVAAGLIGLAGYGPWLARIRSALAARPAGKGRPQE